METPHDLTLSSLQRAYMILDSYNTTDYSEKYRLMWWSSYTTPVDSAVSKPALKAVRSHVRLGRRRFGEGDPIPSAAALT